MNTLNTYENWNAREYLNQYYSGNTIPDDSVALISFLQRNLSDRRFKRCLDFGCGPSLYAHFGIVDCYDEVTWADYAADNRAEIQKWLNQSEEYFDWSHYARHALELAGVTPTRQEVAALESKLRQKSVDVIPADITSVLPLGESLTFDLVVSYFCLECVGGNVTEWHTYLRRLCELVAPGGRLIMAALRESASYKVFEREFPVTYMDTRIVERAFKETGRVLEDTLAIEEYDVQDWANEGFVGIILVSADRL